MKHLFINMKNFDRQKAHMLPRHLHSPKPTLVHAPNLVLVQSRCLTLRCSNQRICNKCIQILIDNCTGSSGLCSDCRSHFCIDLNWMWIECRHRIRGNSTNMCGNTNIDDTSEHVLEITLWVINGYTTVLENWTGRKHDVMSSVPKPTNMCGNADIDDALEHVWEITLWVINGCTRVPENPTGGNHDVMSSVPESTNMCGWRDTGETMKCVLKIMLWVTQGCTRVQ